MSDAAIPTPSTPHPDEIARLFPSYQIESLIARGGMGAVYKARQTTLDRDVAIKLLPREFGADAQFRDNFAAEARAMARLNHPNLISVYDFGEADGLLFIIMEYVPGKSLFHSAHGLVIEPREAGRIIAGVCDGLAHAHENGILHRDIKPGNILLTPKAEPKIGDFGLARPVGGHHLPGETIFGTPNYTAPEVVSRPTRVDTRADIFSVGVMLHELLTGKLPADDPRPPSRIAGCDPRFDTIVRRATHPAPEMRYPDAATMARELRELLEALAGPRLRTLAATPRRMLPPAHTTRTLRPATPARTFAAGPWLALAAIVAIAATIFLVMRNSSSPAPPTPAATKAPTTPAPTAAPAATKPPSTPAPTPAPAPAPEPAPQPPPVAVVEQETPEPPPTVEPAPAPTPAAPTFDTTAWLESARGTMRDKATPVLRDYDAALERNVDAFQRDVNRSLRRLENDLRDSLEETSDGIIDTFREQDNRIPKVLDLGFDRAPLGFGRNRQERERAVRDVARRVTDDHRTALAKQTAIDNEFQARLRTFANSYTFGIGKQIERLTSQGSQDEAIAALQTEVDATKERPERFTRLMRGLDPDPPPEPPPTEEASPPNRTPRWPPATRPPPAPAPAPGANADPDPDATPDADAE